MKCKLKSLDAAHKNKNDFNGQSADDELRSVTAWEQMLLCGFGGTAADTYVLLAREQQHEQAVGGVGASGSVQAPHLTDTTDA